MALIYPVKGTAATLTLGTSTLESSIEITNIDWSGIERAVIETTHLTSSAPAATSADGAPATNNLGGRTYMFGKLQDPGDITIECNFNPNIVPPFMVNGIALNSETITITIISGSTTSATWAVTGGLKSFKFDVPLEDKCSATLVWKASGLITVTAGT